MLFLRLLTKKTKRGFTLIEILVVTVVIILLSGFTLAYYNNLSSAKELEVESQKMIDVMSLAKKKASAGDVSATTSCTNPTDSFAGYRMNFGSSSYTLDFCCDDDGDTTLNECRTPTRVSTYTLPATITSSPPSTSVQFKPLSGTSLTTALALKLKSSKSSECIDITITVDGVFTRGDRYTGGTC